MGEAQCLEERQQALFLEELLKLGWNLESPFLFVLPELDLHHVAGLLSYLLPHRLGHTDQVLRIAVLKQSALFSHTIESNIDRYSTFRAEFFFDVVGKDHVRPT